MPTDIEWTHFPGTIGETWNPINATRLDSGKRGWHCEKVSPGCVNCYAETFNGRNLPACGTGLDYTVPNRTLVQIGVHEDTLDKPLHWTKPRTVFVCSMTDLFAEFVTDEMIDRVFAVMMLCDSTRSRAVYKGVHQFIVLTKRAKRMATYMKDPETRFRIGAEITNLVITGYRPTKGGCDWHECTPWPPENVILGVSVENQRYADERIPELLGTPAACRFLSVEPMLGPVDLMYPKTLYPDGPERCCDGHHCGCQGMPTEPPLLYGIDWVIAGGESGPGARPMHPDWARSLRDQCTSAGVPFFFKQFGAWSPYGPQDAPDCFVCEQGCVGPIERDAMLACEKLHSPANRTVVRRVGKKKAGRLLDGREWSEFPKLAVRP